MYEDSIQELNNLIGELDSFQREHEQKMKDKQRDQKRKPAKPLSHDVHNTTADTTLTASSIGDTSDIYCNFDKLSISSNDPNPLMCSTTTHSSEMTFGSDATDGLNDVIDCQATTMSLKLNLSTTEHPLIMHTSSNSINTTNGISMTSTNSSNGSTTVRQIELIPNGYNVSDDYVKEHTEIVVLRRKDSQSDLMGDQEAGQNYAQTAINGGGKDVERISSFRCSSFSKMGDNKSTLKRGQSITSADSIAMANQSYANDHINGKTVMTYNDHDVVDSADRESATMQMIRQKPVITPRPASLSGWF